MIAVGILKAWFHSAHQRFLAAISTTPEMAGDDRVHTRVVPRFTGDTEADAQEIARQVIATHAEGFSWQQLGYPDARARARMLLGPIVPDAELRNRVIEIVANAIEEDGPWLTGL